MLFSYNDQCLDNVKMFKYAKFYQQIQCCPRVMSILPKSPQPAEMMTPRHRFAYQWLDNVELNEYAQFDSNMAFVSRIIRISTN